VHIQAPEIMMRFTGQVEFGKDPKGILFYESFSNASVTPFTVRYFNGPGAWKTVRVDFFELQDRPSPTPKTLARFLAKVDTRKYKLPPIRPGPSQGRWSRLKAATSRVDVLRQQDEAELSLQFEPLHREVFFNTTAGESIDASGTLIFSDLAKLRDYPLEDDRRMLVNYGPNKIVFYLPATRSERRKEFGLFIPDYPLNTLGESRQAVPATWEDYEPDPGVMEEEDVTVEEDETE